MKKIYLITGLVILTLCQAVSKENWNEGLQAINPSELSITGEASWMYMSPNDEGEWEEYRGTQAIYRNGSGQWEFQLDYSLGSIHAVLSPDFHFLSEETLFHDSQIIEEIGADRILCKLDGRKLLTRTFLRDNEIDYKESKFDGDSTSGNGFSLQLYALAASGNLADRELHNILGGQYTKGEVSFTSTSNPLSLSAHDYDFPEKFRQALDEGDYILADFALTGVYGMVYPYHFYYAFRQGQKMELAAMWSGKPEEASYSWRTHE